MGVNGKKKGSKNERAVCKFMEEWSGYEFSRVPASGGLRWKNTDNITGDIICSDPKGNYRFNLSIECKSYNQIKFEHLLLPNNKVQVLDFWEQSVEDGLRGDKEPMLFMRYNGMPASKWFVMMDFNTWEFIQDNIHESYQYFIIQTDNYRLVLFMSDNLLKYKYKKFIRLVKKIRKNAK